MDVEQLRTLAAVIDAGTFDKAAQTLHITSPAVSHRIKALERDIGRVLVHRSVPVEVTEAGESVLRLARQVIELELATRAEIGQGPEHVHELAIAVNADSLSTWFRGVLTDAASWSDVTVHLHLEDEDHSRQLLQRGEVSAAITTSSRPVAGCRTFPLGSMRFRPMISPQLLERFRKGRGVDLGRCPLVMFSEKDDLQHDQLAALRDELGAINPPRHVIGSSESFVRAVADGLGWGMVATLQLADGAFAMTDQDLVRVPGVADSRVELYLQRWSMATVGLERLEESVRRHSRILGR